MYIKNKNFFSKNKIPLLVGLGIVSLAVAGGIWYLNRPKPPTQTATQETRTEVNKVDYGPAKTTDKVQDSAKDELAKPTPEGQDSQVPAKSPLSVTISNASQQEATVIVRALIDGAASGTCTLTASLPGQAPLTRTASTNAQASYVICQGFNVPVSDFPASGNWQIEVQIESGNSKASAKTNVEIRK